MLKYKHKSNPTKLRDEMIEVNKFHSRNSIVIGENNNTRRCGICNIAVHRASLAKHLRSKKHL